MSKIQFNFIPIPTYFFETGWLNPEEEEKYFKRLSFLVWAFRRCQAVTHTTVHDNRELTLEPFEFICGRESASKETGLTPKEVRGQLKYLLKSKIVKKGANSRANRFTTYIWVTDHFIKDKGQQKGQQRANRGPTQGHKEEEKNLRNKEPSPRPPKKKGGVVSFFPSLDRVDIPIDEKKRIMDMEFTEERINLAVDYVIAGGNKIRDPVGSIIWHCKQDIPPVNSSSSLQTPQQKMALEYGKVLSQNGWDEIAQENVELILKGSNMKCFTGGAFITVSLKNPTEILRSDLEQSKKELKNKKQKVNV